MKNKLSGTQLKLYAVITMLIDHIGAVLLSPLAYPLTADVGNKAGFIAADLLGKLIIVLHYGSRFIGRTSFPIFCFLIAEGVKHTRSRGKYFLRLSLFALISEIPFDLAFFGKWLYLGKQNVFFTLAAGAAVICVVDWLYKKAGSKRSKILAVAVSVIFVIAAVYGIRLLHTDYSYSGMLLILFFYLFRNMPLLKAMSGGLLLGDKRALLAFVPMYFYNGERGICPKALKYGFYIFYPAHLLVLAGIAFLVF